MAASVTVREIREEEFEAVGHVLVEAYAGLQGFPSPEEAPEYYELLANVGRFTEKNETAVLVAVAPGGAPVGGVVYFGDMSEYGVDAGVPSLKDASGIRLLGVAKQAQGLGVGRVLTLACIERARGRGHSRVVLHTTKLMTTAWRLYERLGFVRAPELDFAWQDVDVLGFSLEL